MLSNGSNFFSCNDAAPWIAVIGLSLKCWEHIRKNATSTGNLCSGANELERLQSACAGNQTASLNAEASSFNQMYNPDVFVSVVFATKAFVTAGNT
jgi:hypothetical protein